MLYEKCRPDFLTFPLTMDVSYFILKNLSFIHTNYGFIFVSSTPHPPQKKKVFIIVTKLFAEIDYSPPGHQEI
jgi:hypothetical protein